MAQPKMRSQAGNGAQSSGRARLRTLDSGLWTAPKRGFTLVEILVVLVVLILGILLIARLFPQGFATIGFTANKTTAMALAQEQEDFLRKHRENLPDAVVAVDPTGRVRTEITPADYRSSLPYGGVINAYAGPAPDDPRFSDVNQARRVIGEAVKVPPPSVSPDGTLASIHTTLFSPIYSAANLSVYSGTPMRRVVFQDPVTPQNWNELSRLGPYGYGVNYDRRELYFAPVNYARQFRIEYRYQDPSGISGEAPLGASFTIPANAGTTPDVYAVPLPNANASLDAQSDQIYHVLQPVTAGQPFSTVNPFEYKVYDTLLGLIGFHPDLSSQALPQREGRGLIAKIDYDVDDWHILRQDEVISTAPAANGLYAVQLAAAGVKKLGDVEDPIINLVDGGAGAMDAVFEHQGLVRNYPGRVGTFGSDTADPADGVDLVVVDMQSGLQVDSRTLQKDGNSSNGYIDYEKGVVYLRDTASFRLASASQAAGPGTVALTTPGRHLRIYYRSPQDFAMAVFKPYSGFYREIDPNTLDPATAGGNPMQPGEYFFDEANGHGYLLLAGAHQDQSLSVDYTYATRDSNGNVAMQREVGEVHRAEKVGAAMGPAVGPNLGWLTWVRVGQADVDPNKDPDANPTTAPVDPGANYSVIPGSVRILGVRGTSMHTRIVWRDANRPRHLIRTTVLTREQGR